MTISKPVLSLAVILFAFVPRVVAQGTYTQFDPPASLGTVPTGMDSAGDVVGYYYDPSGTVYGFILSGGAYTVINDPIGTQTYAWGINDNGQVVGYVYPGYIGFVYDIQAQTFTSVVRPGASQTFLYAINNSDTIVGISTRDFNEVESFELFGSDYHEILVPRAKNSYVTCITDSGMAIGYVNTSSGPSNFLFGGSTYKHLPIPNAPSAQVNGVNPAVTAFVGGYVPSSGVYAGFVYQNKALQTLQFPGMIYTVANGVDAAGEVVGSFIDANGVQHGFTWTPPVAAQKK